MKISVGNFLLIEDFVAIGIWMLFSALESQQCKVYSRDLQFWKLLVFQFEILINLTERFSVKIRKGLFEPREICIFFPKFFLHGSLTHVESIFENTAGNVSLKKKENENFQILFKSVFSEKSRKSIKAGLQKAECRNSLFPNSKGKNLWSRLNEFFRWFFQIIFWINFFHQRISRKHTACGGLSTKQLPLFFMLASSYPKKAKTCPWNWHTSKNNFSFLQHCLLTPPRKMWTNIFVREQNCWKTRQR